MFVVLQPAGSRFELTDVTDTGAPIGASLPVDDLAAAVAEREHLDSPRWVIDDVAHWYPGLLSAEVRIARCVDLRLTRAILRSSTLTSGSRLARGPRDAWDSPRDTGSQRLRAPVGIDALFDLDDEAGSHDRGGAGVRGSLGSVGDRGSLGDRGGVGDAVAEFARQREAIAGTADPARIGLLLAAESAGALAAAEMAFVGLPWRADVHLALLEQTLGRRPRPGERPPRMAEAAARIREALGDPELNPDSPAELLRALRSAGIPATSTRSWELSEIDHPAIVPVLEYKKLARLASAHGWAWLETNVTDGRFRPDFIPGGVVTGRWASKGGGGALQLPRQVRGAAVADPGWTFVVADAAQLEPRILAALAADRGMIAAGSAGDLYEGIVASGAVASRAQAKLAMLGAMYGATSGEAGRLLPRLARSFPRAIALVEDAARAGESGRAVTTHLGRSSPTGPASGFDETLDAAEQARARSGARSRGRFTRNFIVQGTAAEWALCWMAEVRRRLFLLAAGSPLRESPHLVFFVHDELVVHCPIELAEQVGEQVRHAAADAGRLLFAGLPASFPVSVAIVRCYGEAK